MLQLLHKPTHIRGLPGKKGEDAMAESDVRVEELVLPIEKLIANDANPRRIKDKQFQALKKSLEEFPEMKQLREVVVDENFVILGGHQRIYALKDLGYSEVQVKQVFGFTEKQKREFIIKDNTASGEWDTDIIANQWDVEELENWGVPNFNFGDIDPEGKDPAAKDDKSKLHVCPDCGFEFED